MKKQIITTLLFLTIALAACTNESKTREILENEGFTEIKITGYAAFMCSENDTYSTAFIATNKAGKRVSGAVCGGWGKGYTIRYD